MREIKFRAWDSKKKVMYTEEYYNITFEFQNDTWDVLVDLEKEGKPVGFWNEYPDVLVQYTGLKDKNGKEIYEGDIITGGVIFGKFLQSSKWDAAHGRCRSYVTYNEKFCSFELKDWGYFGDGLVEVEVIGNIYENPELLNQDES